MSLDQISKSIEVRVAELNHEITTLQAARAALTANGSRETTPPSPPGKPARRRRRTPKFATATPSTDQPTNTDNTANANPPAHRSSAKTSDSRPSAARRTRNRTAGSKQRSDRAVADTLQMTLSDTPDGLSASTLSKRANASYNKTLSLLRELERGGQVQRTGTRRTSLWRLITEEDRIAARAAELERQQAATTAT